MRDSLRWAYALNQWNFRLDVFVRHEDQQRALKTVSACGFDHVELAAGTGRWDNLGRPEVILLNHGSHEGFLGFLRRASVEGVSSMFWDPGQPVEEEGWAFRSTANSADHAAIVESARPFVEFLAGVGAAQLVVRPVGSAWMSPPLTPDGLKTIGEVWNRVGELARASGVGVALHYDCLSAAHSEEELTGLLEATDPALVGLALDTAELTVGGIDPVAFYGEHAERVTHVHLKDTRHADTGEEYRMPGAETTMLRGGPAGGSSAGSSSWAPTAAWSTSRRSSRACGSAATRAGSSSRATTAATLRSWRCSTAGTCSTSSGWRSHER